MGKGLLFSIIINVLFVLFGIYVIQKRGGVDYLKIIFNQLTTKNSEPSYSSKFYKARKKMFEAMPNEPNEIIFLGNSIIEFCNWNELFKKSAIKNRGISGDVINGIINRLEEITASKPNKIFLMIGTNDLGYKRTVDQILLDYEHLVHLILTKTPKTTLYLQSVLPVKNSANRTNAKIIAINKGISLLAKKHSLVYINLFDLFKTENNDLNMSLSFDGLHLNGQGYLIWKEAIIEYVEN